MRCRAYSGTRIVHGCADLDGLLPFLNEWIVVQCRGPLDQRVASTP